MSKIRKINGKYYDFGCSNESFLLTAKELQQVGIENYYFMLRIDNPRIADIDPFKPNITEQEMAAVLMEAKHNIWYFARTCVRMRTGKGIVPFCLHRGIAAAMWCFERSQDFCLNEPRQTYKTTGTIGACVQWVYQMSSNNNIHFFGKETENTKRNLEHLKHNIELLPEWMQFRTYQDESGKIKKTRAATEIMRSDLLHNVVNIHPKPTSLAHAQGMGRGGSGNILYFDEIEHTPYFGELLSNSAPLFKTASENARASGKIACRILTTTPGNLDTKEGRDAMPIIESMIPWTEKIYDWTPKEIEEYKEAFIADYHDGEKTHTREVIDVFYMEYQYYQVRKDFNWVKEQYKLSGDKMAIRREILLQRLRGSTESPIDPEDIGALVSNQRKSSRDLIIDHRYRFRLYDHGAGLRYGRPKDLDEDIPYLVGIDPAAGGGGDNFAITIVNPYNLQIAAEFKSPYLPGTHAVKLLVTLVQDYIPKAVLIPEKNSMGVYLIQMIVDQTSIKNNLYWSEKEAAKQLEQLTEETPEDRQLREMSQQYKKYGTYLTASVRKAMFEILFRHVAECKQILNTEYLVDDICKLIRTKHGKIAAGPGEHDDCLMSYLHTMYVYYFGDNLEYFGIIRNENPVLGAVEEDFQSKIDSDVNMMDDLNGANMSYNEMVMRDAARVEGEIQEIITRLPFVRDGVYSKRRDQDPNAFAEEMVDIPVHFFDQINGVSHY